MSVVGLGQVGAHAALFVSQFVVEKVEGEIVVACKGEQVCVVEMGARGAGMRLLKRIFAQVEYGKGCVLLASATRRLA